MSTSEHFTLAHATNALKASLEKMNPRYYPHFHIAPPAAWMNDPNGLVFYNNQYHVFYQHHPYDQHWGPMHWGHAVSDDLVHWTHLPIAIAPDQIYDRDGCFSGSAIEYNGMLCLVYTGHVVIQAASATQEEILEQVQCLATSTDGIHFEKQGVVLKPEPGIIHFRDPKVWQQDGQFWMVVGQKTLDSVGQVRLYKSSDLKNWEFDQVLVQDIDPNVFMLECPDFFELDGKWILMFSPQGYKPEGYKYRNKFQSGYIVGNWAPNQTFKIEKEFTEMDFGHDFYAPQSFLTKDKRRVIYGWMDMWESEMPSKEDFWMGSLTLPRQLRLDETSAVRNKPVEEVKLLRVENSHQQKANITLTKDRLSTKFSSDQCEIKLVIDRKQMLDNQKTQDMAERYGIEVAATEDGKQATLIYIDEQSQRIVLDRTLSGKTLKGYRTAPLPKGDLIELDIYVDSSSVEVFVNGDEYSFSSRIYPTQQDSLVIHLFSENGSAIFKQLDVWKLNPIFIK